MYRRTKIVVEFTGFLGLYSLFLSTVCEFNKPNRLDLPTFYAAIHQLTFWNVIFLSFPSVYIFLATHITFWLKLRLPYFRFFFLSLTDSMSVKDGPSQSAVYCVRMISNRFKSPSG